MKKTLQCLILAAVMLFSCVALTACSYNWEKGAASAVTLDLTAALNGKTLKADKVATADADYLNDAIHSFKTVLGADKSLRKTGDAIAADDTVTLDISVKQGVLFYESDELLKKTGVTIDLGTEAPNATEEPLNNTVYGDLKMRIDAGEVKVGETYTCIAVLTVKKSDTTSTGVVSVVPADENAAETYITYTVKSATKDGSAVTLDADDIFTVYYIREVGTEIRNADKNWSYNFSSNSRSGGLVEDPYSATLSAEFRAALVGDTLNDSAKRGVSGDAVKPYDIIKVTVHATYNDGEKDVKINDIDGKAYTIVLGNISTDEIVKRVRTSVLDSIGGASPAKMGDLITIGEETLYISAANNAFLTAGTFYKAESATTDNTSPKNVKFSYSIDQLYTGDWKTVTVTENLHDVPTEVVYNYYLGNIKTVADEITLKDLTDSAVANTSKDDEGNTRNLYLATSKEYEEDGVTETGYTLYTLNAYGETLFKTKSDDDGKITEILSKDGETLKLHFAETDVTTEADAVTYAIEQYVLLYEKNTKKKNGIAAIWNAVKESADVKVPKKLLDEYYDEYYQNLRYDFYVTNGGKISDTSVSFETFEEYLLDEVGVKTMDEVRSAVDKEAEKAIAPRLLIYALADALDVDITEEDWEMTMSYVDYLWQVNNYNYLQYYLQYQQYIEYFNVHYYENVEDFIAAQYGSEEGIRVAVLFDKSAEKLYDEAIDAEKNPYHLAFDFTGDNQ